MKLLIKLSLVAVVGLIILVVAGAMLSGSLVGKAVTQGVNTLGPKLTGTTVSLEKAYISVLSGQGTLTGLTVGNPDGWSDRDLAKLGQVHVDIDPMSLLDETIVVEDILIEAPEFSYETKLITSNVKELLKAVEQATGGPPPEPEAAPAEEEGSTERLIAVKRFILKGGKVTIGAGPSAVTVPLPDLELNDLGTPEKGLTSRQLALAVTREVTGDIVVAAVGALKTIGTTSGAGAVDGVKKMGEKLKGIFGKDD